MSDTKFSLAIEKMKLEQNLPYMDTIIMYCDQENLDIESIGNLVNQSLKEKIQVEAMNHNLIPKTASLPFS